MLRDAPKKKGPRCKFAAKTALGSDLEKARLVYGLIQDLFGNCTFL